MGEKSERAQRIGRLTAAAAESRQVHRDDVLSRNRALREADAAGITLRELSDWSGLSVPQISRIVAQAE